MRVEVSLDDKNGQVALDQIRSIDNCRIYNKIENLKLEEVNNLRQIFREYLTE